MNLKLDKIKQDVMICAENGYRGNFSMNDGKSYRGGYITGTNWEVGVISIERVGDRSRKPIVLRIEDIVDFELIWNV